jgi:hypothetical protein
LPAGDEDIFDAHGLMKKPFASRFTGILLRGGDENG